MPAYKFSIFKAQGQTLQRMGLILIHQCFAHGQLYVAISRVTKMDGILIFSPATTKFANSQELN